MQTAISKGETSWLLEQWGIWIKIGHGMPKYVLSAKPYCMYENLPFPRISDDQAIFLDRKIARLSVRCPEFGKAVKLYYPNGCNISFVRRAMGVSRPMAKVLVESGTAWIDAALMFKH